MNRKTAAARTLGFVLAASLCGVSGVDISLFDGGYAFGVAQAAPSIDESESLIMQPQNLPMKGNPNAVVTIIEFSDYQCPFCSRVEPTIKQLLDEYPDKIRVAFVHMPLAFHAQAKSAAAAAHAAFLQNRFWEMHDILFQNQRSLSEDFYIETARKLELNVDQFISDMNSESTSRYVDKCINDAKPYDISGTPSFLINGVKFVGAQPIDSFKSVIDQEIKRAEETAKEKKLSGDELYKELVKTAPQPAPKRDSYDDDDDDEPEGRVYIEDGKSAVIGNNKAPVTIVAYLDMQCPFSNRSWDTIQKLIRNNPNKFRIVIKHFPLSFHKDAKLAARAVEAAKKQKKAEQYIQKLFDNQKALDRDSLIKYAKDLKLNEKKFIADMDGTDTAGQVMLDIESGEKVGVRGTPHFFMNGTRITGAQPVEEFQKVLDAELLSAEPYLKGKNKLSGQKLYEQIVKDNPVPEKPPIVVNTKGAPTLGPDDAPVTIIEFGDFQCPFCKRANDTVHELMNMPKYKGKIKLVFMQFPLPFHRNANIAAQASLFAHEYGKFWEMHNILFANQEAIDRENLLGYAAQIGLDATALDAALEREAFQDVIDSQMKEGQSAKVSGTPSFVINGVSLVGAQPLEKFQEVVDRALEKANAQDKSKNKK